MNGQSNIIKTLNDSEENNDECFKLIANIETSAIITITDKYIISFANAAAERIFGYETSELINKNITMLIPKYVHNIFLEALNKFITTGKKEVFFKTAEFLGLHKSGKEIPLELAIGQHIVHGNHLITYIFSDRTALKMSEDKQIKLENQICQLQRLETIGSLTNGIAHDFKNILTPILGYTELAQEDLPESSMAYCNLQHVKKAVNRAKELVNQILNYNREYNGVELKPILITPIIKEVLKLMHSSIPPTIDIQSEIDSNCGYIMANSIQIHQVLMNLCTNAFHAMKDSGGVLKVVLQPHVTDKHMLNNNDKLLKGPFIKLSVEDTGHGIDESIIQSIFDPFFTTKERGEGSGVGLALVRDIITTFGGEITVKSAPDKGTCFDIYFHQTSNNIKSEIEIKIGPVPRGNEKILYVDTEEEINTMSKRILERLGYQVSTTTNSVDALKLFYSKPDNFDLVITDEVLPCMSGVQLAKEIICVKPRIPIIIVTNNNSPRKFADCNMLGISDFIAKPIIPHELGQTVRRVIDRY